MTSRGGEGNSRTMNDTKKQPKRLRRLTNIYQSNPRYFLTLCTEGRERSLASNSVHSAFVEFMRGSPQRYGWFCGEYVLMPDHVHYFAASSPNGVALGAWVKAAKAFTRHANTGCGIHWQKGFLTTCCVPQNPIRKNGHMSGKTRFAQVLWKRRMIGPFLGKLMF